MFHVEQKKENKRKLFIFEKTKIKEGQKKAEKILEGKTHLTIINTEKDPNQNKWLGQELKDCLIYINKNTRVNNILSVLGCVKGGCKIFFVFAPDIHSCFYDLFFIPNIKNSHNLLCDSKEKEDYLINPSIENLYQLSLTNSPIHLIGERGTGKSTLIGKYIKKTASLSNYARIVLISPSKKSSVNTIRQITNVSRETFVFFPADKINKQSLLKATHVLIDESASLGEATIKKIIKIASKATIVLATTLDGYEGVGQSYRLSTIKKGVVLELTDIKRFSKKDDLYRLTKKLCHPDSYNYSIKEKDATYIFNEKDLINKSLTLPVFALLKQAHYKTTPNDIANIYNNKGIFILIIEKGQIVAATHIIPETSKDLNEELIIHIFNGKRRAKGMLTQQSILNAYGCLSIANKKVLRVSRIAVKDDLRRKRLGSKMISMLEDFAKTKGFDIISASFSCKKDSLSFWLQQGFILSRIGNNKNKWHNNFSVIVTKALTQESKSLAIIINNLCKQHYMFFIKEYEKKEDNTTILIKRSFIPTLSYDNSLKNNFFSFQKSMESVTSFHRDINWFLPELYRALLKNKNALKNKELSNPIFSGKHINKKQREEAIKYISYIKNTYNLDH